MSQPVRIEDLDRHFTGANLPENLRWIDGFDPCLRLRGLGWVDEAYQSRSFGRVPLRALEPLSAAVQTLSRCPSSAFLAFRTDAQTFAVRQWNGDAQGMNHMPMTGSNGVELYTRGALGWMPLATSVPNLQNHAFERLLVSGLSRKLREYRLYLPLYKKLEAISLGIDAEAVIEPVLPSSEKKPIVFYGTSVTQGGCANTAGSDYISAIGRMLDVDTINLGFSGNGKGEPELAHLIREIDASVFVIQYASNCEPRRVEETLPDFIRILRERHASTPIALLTTISFNRACWDRELREKMIARRDIQFRAYLAAKDAGDQAIHLIDGEGILPPGLSGTFVDGLHPTSGGFSLMAERLAPHLAMILGWQEELGL